MLKARVNVNDLRSGKEEITVTSTSTVSTGTDYASGTRIVNCYYSNELSGEDIVSVNVVLPHSLINPSGELGNVYTNEDVEFLGIDTVRKYITLRVKAMRDLPLSNIEVKEYDGVPWMYFTFSEPHFFDVGTDMANIFVSYTTVGGVSESVMLTCWYDDNMTVRWRMLNGFSEVENLMKSIFSHDYYVETEEEFADSVEVEAVPATADYTSPAHIKIKDTLCDTDLYYHYYKVCSDPDLSSVTVQGPNIWPDTFTITVNKEKINLTLPISQCFETRLEQPDVIVDRFNKDAMEESINPSPDMEKFIYHPAMPILGSDGEYEFMSKIKFNLHFRQHDGDNWSTSSGKLWNGVDNNTFELLGSVGEDGEKFFSYSDKSKQSDLLCYLGFTNKDVRFQKNKLKKSFLRLSFYDSMNPGKQNLLSYSTIFLNGGELFSKMMKTAGKTGYVVENVSARKAVGGSVSVEPGSSLVSGLTDDEIEDLRLSSQISVSARGISRSSSDGFYLYVWADDSGDSVAGDLYMKVEFMHAGYGRVLPMMVPYFEAEKDGKLGIKSFADIAHDWSGNGYGIKLYNKYSYVHWKYAYSPVYNKHVYYLDPDQYGDDAYYNTGTNADGSLGELEINLYEANVNFYNDNDANPAILSLGQDNHAVDKKILL